MPADELAGWRAFHKHTPIDDQSNHHRPIARLNVDLLNINRSEKTPQWRFEQRMEFAKPPEPVSDDDLDAMLLGNW